MTTNAITGYNGSISTIILPQQSTSENKANVGSAYDPCLPDQKRLMEMAAAAMALQQEAIDTLMKTVISIQKQTKEERERQEEFEKYLDGLEIKRLTTEEKEASQHKMEQSQVKAEQLQLKAEKSQVEAEEAILKAEEATLKATRVLKQIEESKNRSLWKELWISCKAIGEHFKQKVFKGQGSQVQKNDTNNTVSQPPTGESTGQIRYTYLNPKNLAIGGAVVAGGFFFYVLAQTTPKRFA